MNRSAAPEPLSHDHHEVLAVAAGLRLADAAPLARLGAALHDLRTHRHP